MLNRPWVPLLVILLFSREVQAEPTVPASRQSIYDAAQAAFDKNDWEAASKGFGQLLPGDGNKPLLPSEAVIGARYANALVHLGQLDDAQSWINRALPSLPKSDPIELSEAWITKGDVERYKYDYATALEAYKQADVLAEPLGMNATLLEARLGEAFVGATLDPAFVKKQLESLKTSAEFRKSAKAQLLADIDDLEARAAINMGDKDTARILSRRAVDESGGLTTTVSTTQVAIRADAAAIAKLSGWDEDAKRYLAYTGAGHLKDMAWVSQHSGDLPICDDDVRPDDSVIVALAIGDDGHVVGAIPTYASRQGVLGATFAKALSTWHWSPEAIRKVEPFWRATLQLGLRCVTRPNPEQLGAFTAREVGEWLRERKVIDVKDSLSNRNGVPNRIQSTDPRVLRPGGIVLAAIAGPAPKSPSDFEVQWNLLENANAPPAAFAISISNWASQQARKTDNAKQEARIRADALGRLIPSFQSRFPNNRAGTWLVLMEALELQDSGDFAGAQPLLASITRPSINGQPNEDPLGNVALLHQAIGLERAGKSPEARDSLERSGLNENKCSLFDTHPVVQQHHIGSEAYPEEAMRWQFEGFVQEAFDIADDGSVKNVRTVIAYPPFVFDQSTERAVKMFSYIPPRLGGKAVGCEAQTTLVQYRVAQ